MNGILICQRDYTDKWKMSQHGQTQNEDFAQDQALGIEGFYFDVENTLLCQRDNYYYGVLFDENEQNASTTYANTRLILNTF